MCKVLLYQRFSVALQVMQAYCRSPSLVEVLHEVPPLWDVLDSGSLKALLSTNAGLRSRAKQHVRSIKTGNENDTYRLICSTWTQHVQILHLRGSNLLSGELSAGDARELQCFTLFHPRWKVTAGVIQALSGKWPSLQTFCSVNCVLGPAALSELTVTEWPLLRTFHLSPLDVAMPDLVDGHWPQLRDLSIGLDMYEDGPTLSLDFPWSTLERLQLSLSQICAPRMDSLVQAYLPNLQELSLVEIPGYSSLTNKEKCLCFEVLAQGKWPLLGTLELRNVDMTQECIRLLGTGNWLRLQRVVFDNLDISDKDVSSVVKACWPALRSLTVVGFNCFKSTTFLDLWMQKWPNLQCLTVCVASNGVAAAILEKRNNLWPGLRVQFRHTQACVVRIQCPCAI